MPLSHLQPNALWQFFQLLCDTPRPSQYEQLLKQRIRDEILGFNNATERPIEVSEDQAGNLILRKAASPGCASARGVILQSHLDMVTQQNAGTGHDFLTDPIDAYIDGDWVTAKGTTLGADNGIGVAAILAVLCNDGVRHGPLEAVLTVNEECGMSGAKGIDQSAISGSLLLNLDTEEEGELYIGCAGGIDVTADWEYLAEPPDTGMQFHRIMVKGLRGGHSGIDIHKGYGNAVKLINRLVRMIFEKYSDCRVACLDGGTMRNAIPREAVAVIGLQPGHHEHFQQLIAEAQTTFQHELSPIEPNLSISVEEATPEPLIPAQLWRQVSLALQVCPSGVFRMNPEFQGVTETSNNLASVRVAQGVIEVQCLTRSLIDTRQQDAADTVKACFELAEARVSTAGWYPGWKPDKNSKLLAELSQLHKKTTGKEAKIHVIHAGLECGILGSRYPDWDMISFGPTIRGAHSPDEAVNIPSVLTFWNFLLASLSHLAATTT